MRVSVRVKSMPKIGMEGGAQRDALERESQIHTAQVTGILNVIFVDLS